MINNIALLYVVKYLLRYLTYLHNKTTHITMTAKLIYSNDEQYHCTWNNCWKHCVQLNMSVWIDVISKYKIVYVFN